MPAAESKPLLTIIMPVYNAAHYMETALQNISTQSFNNYELLILDALSTDSTRSIVEAKQKYDQRIRIYSEKDKGIYDAMNKGLALAKGEWVYFMGCDDGFFHATVLQQIVPLLSGKNDLVYGDVLWVPDEILEKGVCSPADLVNRNVNHQRIFYRKSLFEKYGAYDLQYQVASDHELNIRFFCTDNIRKKYIPVTIARYHSGGFSANKLDIVFWKNWKAIFRKNFSKQLPTKTMYDKLGWYCRYQIDEHQYRKAFILFWDVFLHTGSAGFVWLTIKQFFLSFKSK
jgi:glycosyltransferase involved in cell wall biosynthesis